jgi:twinkle protein
MGECLDKIPHSCGTRKGLQVFGREDGTVDGYCFSCGVVVRHPYGDERNAEDIERPEPKTQEEIELEIQEIEGFQTLAIPQKKLKAISLDKFGVKVGVSEADGKTAETVYYPMRKNGVITGYKVKLLPKNKKDSKKMWSIGDCRDGVELFGWREAIGKGVKKLIIVEGEDDAIACEQILEEFVKPEWRDQSPAVVSITRGAGNVQEELSRWKKEIDGRFKEVIICFDTDGAGEEATQKACLIFPNAVAVKLPSKDLNQCILDGVKKAAYNALIFNAERPKNSRLVFGEDLHTEAREPPKYGQLTWPWKTLNDKTRGIRYGETIYIGAGVKMGKSEALNELAAHFIVKHDVKVFMAKPEEANKKTYKLICNKVVGNVFHDPDKEFDYGEFDKAGEIIKGKLAMVNLYQHLGWKSLRDDIIAAAAWGAKAIFIDPITNLTNGINAGDANAELQGIAQDLAALALDLDIVVFIFCHLKAPDGNLAKEKRDKLYREGKTIGLGICPHELGGDVISSQFAGSRAMMRSCNMMLGLEGNKDPELSDEERCLRDIVLLEDREFGETGRINLYWNRNTTRFKELGE